MVHPINKELNMTKLSQKEAVFNAVTEVIGVTRTAENTDPLTLSKDDKASVREILLEGFENNEIELKSNQDDIKKYVNSLLNNWIRKDQRFNGGNVYKAKNPGSRTGQGDAQIKNLRLLLKTPNLTEEARAEIQEAITNRLAEIKPEKKIEVDATAIPEHLQHLVQ
jgi:hypothetical protein